MNESASSQPGAWGEVRVAEPAGERKFGENLTIGGAGSDIVVPGIERGTALTLVRRDGLWIAEPVATAAVRFNGRALGAARDLRRDDVLAIGDAQVIVTSASRTLLRLKVSHLAGNVTIAPAGALAATVPIDQAEDQDVEITVPKALRVPEPPPEGGADRRASIRRTAALSAAALFLVAAVVGFFRLGTVMLEVHPADARAHTPGVPSLAIGSRLFVLPGRRVVRAEHAGYSPAEASVVVPAGGTGSVRLVLEPLPGALRIDTAGVVAAVSIDGVAAGLAPGVISVPAGERTISLRAPRYVDYATAVHIEGAGAAQELHVRLKSAWGTIAVQAIPQGAHVSVDGVESGTAPVSISAPAGVRRIRIAASGWKPWESSVVLEGGATLALGPVKLGEPDAQLRVRSEPEGAEVTVAGVDRGRSPLTLDLPAGIAYPVVLSLPGYASWTQTVFASSGAALDADARLKAVLGRVTVAGEPPDAELFIDGASRGRTPQSLNLSATEHRIEVRKSGFVPFAAAVTPVEDLESNLTYHLTPSERGAALMESAPLIKSQSGYVLRLMPGGTFQMGSERREPGRRPNEGLRSVTLGRPFYIGVLPVTNADFRKFRAAHDSGYIDRQSLDLDNQPVTGVTWDEAADFCNWLSQQDGLPAAYARRGSGFELTRPVTRGYRLPTEAEWEYAARYAAPGQLRRYAWGDALPVPEGVGNLAGSEAARSLPATLPGYRDDYLVLAPVGKFHPTALGLYDMSGNVSQWTNDYYGSFVDSDPATDPLGPTEGTLHVVRGANWQTATVGELRLAWRDGASGSAPTLGFRIARYAEDPQ